MKFLILIIDNRLNYDIITIPNNLILQTQNCHIFNKNYAFYYIEVSKICQRRIKVDDLWAIDHRCRPSSYTSDFLKLLTTVTA